MEYEWFLEHEVASYEASLPQDVLSRVDDATWRDLEVPRYLRLISSESSIFGRQMLYQLLRRGASEQVLNVLKSSASGRPTAALAASAATRLRLRQVEYEPTGLLFHGERVAVPAWASKLWLAPWIGTAIVCWAFLVPGWPAFASIAAYLLVNGWVQLRLHKSLAIWRRQRNATMAMLRGAIGLAEAGLKSRDPVFDELSRDMPALRQLGATFAPDLTERIPYLAEYANLFAMREYALLNERVARLEQHLDPLRNAYIKMATCEATLCVVEHLQSVGSCSWAETCDEGRFAFSGLVNPLLAHPIPLDVATNGKGIFLTGQNGVGKSTLLRSIGLSVLSANAFGFCYAGTSKLARRPLATSIRVEDSLSSGESLYMVELRRARELFAVAVAHRGSHIILDEIFRGTNNLESVSVAAAYLAELANHALVVISTHNLVLAPLLRTRLDAQRITRDEGDAASLRLEPGILAETNGIRMMLESDFPDSIKRRAERVHEWYADYVVDPKQYPDL